MSQQLAILKDPHLWVDDRGLVTLRFDAAMDGLHALQIIYLEGQDGDPRIDGCSALIGLLKAAGDFKRLNGLPIIVNRDGYRTFYIRPAAI